MNHHEHPVSIPPHVRLVTLPADLEYGNAADACRPLTTGLPPGTTTVIADLTATTWCDTGGLHAIVSAHKLATAHGIELRWVVPAGPLTRILELTALDRWLLVYPDRTAALTAGPAPRAAPRTPPSGPARPRPGPAALPVNGRVTTSQTFQPPAPAP
jgi:anti-sigma B factor antagonist